MTHLKSFTILGGLMAFTQVAVAGELPALGVSIPLQFGGIAAIATLSVIIGAQLINRKK